MLEEVFKYFCDADKLRRAQEVVEAYNDFVSEVGKRHSWQISRRLAELSANDAMPWRVDRKQERGVESILLVPDGRLNRFREQLSIGIRWNIVAGMAGDVPWYACECRSAGARDAAFAAFRSELGIRVQCDEEAWAYAYLDEFLDGWPNLKARGEILKLVESSGDAVANQIAGRLMNIAKAISDQISDKAG